jgi:hypothetical protein
MSDQLPLFPIANPEPPPPFQAHSETSEAAADAIKPKAPGGRQRVLQALRDSAYGLTDEELQDMLHMNPSTQRPRRVELVRMGLVRNSGRTRKTRAGLSATVWEVSEA